MALRSTRFFRLLIVAALLVLRSILILHRITSVPDSTDVFDILAERPNGDRFNFMVDATQFPVPGWMMEFLESQPTATHAEMLENPNEKFIVVTCHYFKETLPEDCGGFSDRLWRIPYYLWLAHRFKRRLLIRYTHPFPLEEFMVPPRNGFDWRLPGGHFDLELRKYANRSWTVMSQQRRVHWHKAIQDKAWSDKRVIFVNANLARFNETDICGFVPDDVWAGAFRRMFQPSPPVANIIMSIVKQNGLVPGKYTGAHVRAKFPVQDFRSWGDKENLWAGKIIRTNRGRSADKSGGGLRMSDSDTYDLVATIVNNSINCAVQLMPGTEQVYFASDSSEPTEYLMKESGWAENSTFRRGHKKPKVVASGYTNEPLHFATVINRTETKPAEFYSLFVDFWILSQAKCISHGAGGFGQHASVLTGNSRTCRFVHRALNGAIYLCPDSVYSNEEKNADVALNGRTTFSLPSRAFPLWKESGHPLPCIVDRRDDPNWNPLNEYIQRQPSSEGVLLVKIEKAGSSTIAGVAARISRAMAGADNTTSDLSPSQRVCRCRLSHLWHRRNSGRLFRNRDKSRSFLFTFVREPSKRAISDTFHFRVSREGVEPTDEFVIDYLKKFQSFQLGCVMNDNQGATLTRLKTQSRVDQVVQSVLDEFNFIGVLERLDESLVLLQLILGLETTDVLHISAKQHGSFDPDAKCSLIRSSFVTPSVKEYLSSDEWAENNMGDMTLYSAANRSIDRSIDAIGRSKFSAALSKFQEAQNLVNKKCEATLPCAREGVKRPQHESNCYWQDAGCNYPCLDRLFPRQTN